MCQRRYLSKKNIRPSGVIVPPVLHIFTEKNGDLEGVSEPAMRTVSGAFTGSSLSSVPEAWFLNNRPLGWVYRIGPAPMGQA